MSGHAGEGLHYHGVGDDRYGHSHSFLHIIHDHADQLVTINVCEDCHTFSSDAPLPRHQGHNVMAMTGESYDYVTRAAAAHIVFAQMIRNGTAQDGGVMLAMINARAHADWFSEEDADAYNRPDNDPAFINYLLEANEIDLEHIGDAVRLGYTFCGQPMTTEVVQTTDVAMPQNAAEPEECAFCGSTTGHRYNCGLGGGR